MTDIIQIRALVLEALLEILEKQEKSHLVIGQALRKYAYLQKQDRAFFTRLTEGCVERALTLDYILDQYSKVPVKKMKPVIRNILRMGVYQILYMDGVPDSAACNEAVKLAEKKKFMNLKGFVNGVLRAIAKEKDALRLPDPVQDEEHYLSVFYSMPEWIVSQWNKQYGKEETVHLLQASLKERPLSVRLNTSKASEEEIFAMLKADGVRAIRCEQLPYAAQLEEYDNLNKIQAFRDGYLQVQDISSMLVAEACAVRPGDQILDVCAAPGGKALHLAELLNQTGHVTARDLTEYKVSQIEENIYRCGYQNISAEVWDALEPDENLVEKMDLVLADLPCSGLGVMGRKNDLKYNMTRKMQCDLVQLQRKILSVVWRYVKSGGVLVYSTCTLNREENEENMNWFLHNYPFHLEDLTKYLPDHLQKNMRLCEQMKGGSVTILPSDLKSDGFYFARLRREV